MIRYLFSIIFLLHVCACGFVNETSTDNSSTNRVKEVISVIPKIKRNKSQLINITTINAVHHEYFDRLTCDHNPDVCGKPVCKLRFKTRFTKAATMGCTVLKKPAKTFLFKAQLFYKFTGGYRSFFFDREEDLCKYLNGTRSELILNMLVPNLQYALDMNAACPMTDRIMINELVLGLYLLDNQLLPVGDYYFYADVHTVEYLIISIKLYFTIPAGKSIFDIPMG